MDRERDYGEAKRQAEAAFFACAPFPVVAVRFPIVLGPDDYTGRLKFHFARIRDEKPIHFPNLEAKLSLIHARDAAAFLASLSGAEYAGPVNCCAPEPIELRDLVALIEERVGRKAVLADSGEPSPFGIEGDWFMNTERACGLGFEAEPIARWLPRLIDDLARGRC